MLPLSLSFIKPFPLVPLLVFSSQASPPAFHVHGENLGPTECTLSALPVQENGGLFALYDYLHISEFPVANCMPIVSHDKATPVYLVVLIQCADCSCLMTLSIDDQFVC